MTLKVIGSGLGRTGTKSLQTALNILGFGPCHHMAEVIGHPETMPLWVEAEEGHPNWNAIFTGYRSAVDYPAAAYWRELAAEYPNAKVIHSTRDPEVWFESTQATIFAPDGFLLRALNTGEGPAAFFASFLKPLKGHLNDRAFLIDYFQRHTEQVVAEVPADRLLIYRADEGWEPLCAFLGAPVPSEVFPNENSRTDFGRASAIKAGESNGDI